MRTSDPDLSRKMLDEVARRRIAELGNLAWALLWLPLILKLATKATGLPKSQYNIATSSNRSMGPVLRYAGVQPFLGV